MKMVACKDCEYARAYREYQQGNVTRVSYYCIRSEFEVTEVFNPVTGKKVRDSSAYWCEFERSEAGTCGPDALLFKKASRATRFWRALMR